jgi:hypothetical protein
MHTLRIPEIVVLDTCSRFYPCSSTSNIVRRVVSHSYPSTSTYMLQHHHQPNTPKCMTENHRIISWVRMDLIGTVFNLAFRLGTLWSVPAVIGMHATTHHIGIHNVHSSQWHAVRFSSGSACGKAVLMHASQRCCLTSDETACVCVAWVSTWPEDTETICRSGV